MPLKPYQQFAQRAFLAFSRLSRGMTLGVRAMLIRDGQVLLVKHGYVPGWYFPGGGVEAGETFGAALEREILEEAGARLSGPPQLFGLYRNAHADRRDHVALFVCRDWEARAAPHIPNREIVQATLFPLSDLPADTNAGTRARIGEVLSGLPASADW
jgi:8-oxo-dGTP pyrophosphatase MutT (NUDIX family)